jgi:hypothetical protein
MLPWKIDKQWSSKLTGVSPGPGFSSTSPAIINFDGGGIIMYYTTHVNIKRRVDLENPLVECMWFELTLIDLSICIVSESTYWIESVIKIGSRNEELPVRE